MELRKVPSNFMYFLRKHKDCTQSMIEKAHGLSAEKLETAVDDDIIKIRKMVRSVRNEIHKMRGFVRLKSLNEKVMYGYMDPAHDIGFDVTNLLAKRFPGTIIVLGNSSISWISIFIEDEIKKRTENNLRETLNRFEDIYSTKKEKDDREDVWETYYKSQYTPERKNKKLFKKNMPEKHLKSAGNKTERKFKSSTLKDYLDEQK
ncbi:MAG: DUF4130 domain-containing protein [Thermoplasmatota archaeon]